MDKAAFKDVIDTAVQEKKLSLEAAKAVLDAWEDKFPQWCIYEIPRPDHPNYQLTQLCIIGAGKTYGGERGFKGFRTLEAAEDARPNNKRYFNYMIVRIDNDKGLNRIKNYRKGIKYG